MPTYTEPQLEAIAKVVYANGSTIVPYLAGMWLDAAMMGVVFLMVVQWARLGWSQERKYTKILVIYLFLANIMISGFILHAQIDKFALHYGKYAAFLNPEDKRKFWILCSTSRVPTGFFFAHRAWLISKRSIFIPLTVIPLSLAGIGAAIGAFIVSTEAITPKGSLENPLVTMFCCCGLAIDIINTFTISLGLYRSRTGWKTTDSIVSYWLLVTAETQLPPTIAALSFLICFLGWPNNTFAFMWQGITKVHVICLLVVITARFKLALRVKANSGAEAHELPRSKGSSKNSSKNSGVQVSVESHSHVDSTPHELPYNIAPKPTPETDATSEHRSLDERVVGQNEGGIWMATMTSRTSLV